MIFTDKNEEYSIKQMIIFWSKALADAVERGNMAEAFDIQYTTLPKCFDLYKEYLGNRIVEEN
jgi:hypothetical protein